MRPFWRGVLECMGNWLGRTLPLSPRLCLLGDRSEVQELSKFEYAIVKVGCVTAARAILRLWKNAGMPGVDGWREKMGEVRAWEGMLIRLGGGNQKYMRAWEGFDL